MARPGHRLAAAAFGVFLASAAPGWAAAQPPSPPLSPSPGREALAGELDAVRQQSIAAARADQQREAAIAALEHELDLRGREAEGRQRGLDDSRAEQAQLLATLERLAHHPPDETPLLAEAPIDRIRSGLLIAAVEPALRAEARALSEEIGGLAALRARIAAEQNELAGIRDALARDREQLAQIVARRHELTRQILHEGGDGEGRAGKLGREASDLGDLVKRADAEIDRHDKELLARARAAPPKKANSGAPLPAAADATRPQGLRAFEAAQAALLLPVSGAIIRRHGEAGASGTASQGVSVRAIPAAEAVAPFDGRVVYAGPFRSDGLVLIIRHGSGYHSLLAGLGRVDASVGQWVLAGEPVGAMPDAAMRDAAMRDAGETGSGGAFYFEFRRDGRPVDPQPWLARRDEGTGQSDKVGDQGVRE